jgi:hypothetical protein
MHLVLGHPITINNKYSNKVRSFRRLTDRLIDLMDVAEATPKSNTLTFDDTQPMI